MGGGFWLFVAMTIGGGALMLRAVLRPRRLPADIAAYLRTIPTDGERAPLDEPFSSRVLGAAARAVVGRIERIAPRHYLDTVDRQLAQAGLVGKRRAAEQVAAQLGLACVGSVAVALVLPTRPSSLLAGASLLLPVMGFLLPSARLKRQIRERSDAIFRDVPDIIDMLAIAVEAGSGFEAALSLVCQHFESPLTDELSFALREMELGMTRKQAFQQLKERTDLEVVRTFVVALLQADALGIPIGRVLKAQAAEVRARRRAWAREKAAKLPVKILFPLVAFVFPPILAIVLGPAAMSFGRLG
jgi:tight adherence protein C